MNIFHVLDELDNTNSGPCYSVPSLVKNINTVSECNAEIIVPSISEDYSARNFKVSNIGNAAFINPFQFSESSKYIHSAIRGSNIIHGHGIWRLCNLYYLLRKPTDLCKFVCSPRGMFTEWAMNYKKIRKAPFWKLLQKPALQKVHCFHATSESELEDIRRLGFRQPVALIPNGIDLPELKYIHEKQNIVLFLGRIHEIKGLTNLVRAWERLEQSYPEWKLIIAGPFEGSYAYDLKSRVDKLKNSNIEFAGAVEGVDKEALFARAKLFVLPSFSENFGVVVAESLAHGVPVVTTKGTPWKYIVKKECGWYVDPTAESLYQALYDAFTLKDTELASMGSLGREWMMEDFRWEKIASDMMLAYYWLLNDDMYTRPCFVDVVSK